MHPRSGEQLVQVREQGTEHLQIDEVGAGAERMQEPARHAGTEWNGEGVGGSDQGNGVREVHLHSLMMPSLRWAEPVR